MLAWILECAGLEPGFLVGGVPCAISIEPGHPGQGKGPHYYGGNAGTALEPRVRNVDVAAASDVHKHVSCTSASSAACSSRWEPTFWRCGAGVPPRLTSTSAWRS